MRKILSKAAAFLMIGILAAGIFAGCGSKKAPNPKTASFEEMVDYLKDQGCIGKEASFVDINASEGYLVDNTGGQMSDTAVADKACDYEGLWLFWWDLENQTEFYEVYQNLGANGNTILLGGGAKVLETEGVNGAFAIAFSDDYKDKEKALEVFTGLKAE